MKKHWVKPHQNHGHKVAGYWRGAGAGGNATDETIQSGVKKKKPGAEYEKRKAEKDGKQDPADESKDSKPVETKPPVPKTLDGKLEAKKKDVEKRLAEVTGKPAPSGVMTFDPNEKWGAAKKRVMGTPSKESPKPEPPKPESPKAEAPKPVSHEDRLSAAEAEMLASRPAKSKSNEPERLYTDEELRNAGKTRVNFESITSLKGASKQQIEHALKGISLDKFNKISAARLMMMEKKGVDIEAARGKVKESHLAAQAGGEAELAKIRRGLHRKEIRDQLSGKAAKDLAKDEKENEKRIAQHKAGVQAKNSSSRNSEKQAAIDRYLMQRGFTKSKVKKTRKFKNFWNKMAGV